MDIKDTILVCRMCGIQKGQGHQGYCIHYYSGDTYIPSLGGWITLAEYERIHEKKGGIPPN